MKIDESELRTAQVSGLCRRRLLEYADSFYELAKSYENNFSPKESEDRMQTLTQRRIWENTQILGSHMNEMAKIMTEVACEVLCYRPMEEKKKRILIHALREDGIKVETPCYLSADNGKEAIAVGLNTNKKNGISAEEVCDMISVILNKRLRLSAESPLLVDKDTHLFVLEEDPCFIALTGFSKAVKEGEKISGDNFAVLEPEGGALYMIVSDGTGSGEQAGKDSEKVLDLTEKFLEAGYDIDAAVKMINLTVFAAGEDCNHPTLDICKINLHNGSCEIRKIGGAASFLKRGESVECISEGNLPLGVFQQVNYGIMSRRLQDGDYLILVSDGIIEAFKNQSREVTLCNVISGIKEQNPGEIADKILRTALIAGGGRVPDDMTVGVIGLWESGSCAE